MVWAKACRYVIFLGALVLCGIGLWSQERAESRQRVLYPTIQSIRGARPYEELRGVWIASVKNIDWPMRNATEEEQKALLIYYLDTIAMHNMNAVFFQVKPSGGVIYPSSYAPFAEEFTGQEQIENPYSIDFLEFFVQEAHKRHLEVHAWLNPYRVATHTDKTRLSSKNFGVYYESVDAAGREAPEEEQNRLITYGGRLYLDPGLVLSQDYVLKLVNEIISLYDVDGIHFDDYFYQYKIPGQTWPDDKTWHLSPWGQDCNGEQELADWRRENVNRLVQRVQKEIKAKKPYVKWGISPFGVWRNACDDPSGTLPSDPEGSETRAGVTSYDTLYADARLWYRSGNRYVDYLVPQVYWAQENKAASYNCVVDWWIKEGRRMGSKAGLYIGHALYKAGTITASESWQESDILTQQIDYNRQPWGKRVIEGSVFFTMHDLLPESQYQANPAGADMMQQVRQKCYTQPSVIPPLATMKDHQPPQSVKKLTATFINGKGVHLQWQEPSKWEVDTYGHLTSKSTCYYIVYRVKKGENVQIVAKIRRPKNIKKLEYMDAITEPGLYTYAVLSLDRLHNQSNFKEVQVKILEDDL